MELSKIRELLEKYYDGETSQNEETQLIEFFRDHTVPDDLKTDQELFLYASHERVAVPVSNNLEDKLVTLIDNEAAKENKRAKTFLLYRISSIAAGIAIIVVTWLAVFNKSTEPKSVDTFNDPRLAYEQVKQTLLYISQNLNRGTEKLSHVSKINQGFNGLSAFSSFNSGMKDLELVSKYYNENENKKQ
jgi:hypothetical protein